MPASIRCAQAGVTTGEWADALRAVFGEYRAPTGVVARSAKSASERDARGARARAARSRRELGRPLKLLVGKPGLDGHSNGAEQIAVRARDVGMEVVYEGIRLTPGEIVQSARDEGVHVIGLSILSGSHGVLGPTCSRGLRDAGAPAPGRRRRHHPRGRRRASSASAGVPRVYTPKDFDLTRIMGEIVDVVAEARRCRA